MTKQVLFGACTEKHTISPAMRIRMQKRHANRVSFCEEKKMFLISSFIIETYISIHKNYIYNEYVKITSFSTRVESRCQS